MGARIGAVHDRFVGPFEIERQDQRLADARIPEFLAAGIEEPALRARGRLVGQCFELDAAVLDGGEIVTRRPHPRREFLAEQVVLRGEALEGDVAIPIEFVTHDIVIVEAARNRKVGAPPVPDPLELDVTVDLEFPDLIGPGAEWGIEGRFVERMHRVPGFRENRQARDIKRHIAGALFREGDDQRRVIERFGLHHVAHLHDEQGMAPGLQRREREGGVMGGQLGAVVEPCLRSHRKPVGELVRRNLHRFRGKPVHRVGLVARARHQRCESEIHALRAFTPEDERVERVEGLKRLIVGFGRGNRRKGTAFRRGEIDVIEMMKVGRIFQIAEHRQPMNFAAGFHRHRGPQPHGTERGNAEAEHMPAGKRKFAMRSAQERLPVLAAFSASHHQRFGNPEVPYFGSGSGWLKQSQRAAR